MLPLLKISEDFVAVVNTSPTPTSINCLTRVVTGTSVSDKDGDGSPPPPPPPSGTITAVLTASRSTGPAPLAVQFLAIDTTHTDAGINTFRELGYHFTFDDSGSGTWTHSGESKNAEIGGPIASHVFESPGTYTVKVRAQDSEDIFDDDSVVVTVTDPDTVYSTTSTVVISTNSDTTGAPTGAQLLTNQTSWPTWEDSKRYLLMPGQNYTSFSDIDLFQNQDVQVGKVTGAGADPIVGRIDIDAGSPPTTDQSARIALIDLDSGAIRIPNSGDDIAVIRGNNTDFSVGSTVEFYLATGTQAQKDTIRWPKNIFMYDAVNDTPSAGFNAFLFVNGCSIMGTQLSDPSQHNLRFPYLVRGYVAHNLMFGAGSAHHNIKLHGNGLNENEDEVLAKNSQDNATRWVVVTDNTFGDGTTQVNPWSVAVDPQNNISAEGLQDVITENNFFDHDYQAEFVFGGRRLIERGNTSIGTFNFTTSQNVGALPPEWDGPYFTRTSQIIPGAPI